VATTRLKNATTGLQQIETRYKTLGPDWVTRRSELQGIRKEAAALMVFPAVSAEANRLRVAADDVLKQFVGGDLQAAINAANNARLDKRTLAAAREVLNRQAEAKGVPVGDGKGKPLDDTTRLAFVQGRSNLIELVREGSTAADAALIEHLQANKTLEQGPRRLLRDHWKSLIGKIQADWNAAEQASNGDLKALEQQAKAAVAALERLVKEQTKLKPKELEATLKTLQQDDAKAFEASKPGGTRWSLPPFLLLISAFSMAPFAHGSFFFVAEILKTVDHVDPSAQPLLVALATGATRYLFIAYGVLAMLALVGFAWLTVAIARRRTMYPRWVTLANPLVCILAASVIERVLPQPFKTLLAGAGISLGLCGFFALSTVVLWNSQQALSADREQRAVGAQEDPAAGDRR